jgi:hypothetical protein
VEYLLLGLSTTTKMRSRDVRWASPPTTGALVGSRMETNRSPSSFGHPIVALRPVLRFATSCTSIRKRPGYNLVLRRYDNQWA